MLKYCGSASIIYASGIEALVGIDVCTVWFFFLVLQFVYGFNMFNIVWTLHICMASINIQIFGWDIFIKIIIIIVII